MRPARRHNRRRAVLLVTHESSTGDASLRYRSFHHAESLGLLGVSCDVLRYGAPELPDAIDDSECIVLHRFPIDAAAPLLRRAEKGGKLVLSDTDDLVFDPAASDAIEAIEGMSADWRTAWAESYRATIGACTGGAIASTEPLAERLRSLATAAHVLPNVVGDEMTRLAANACKAEVELPSRPDDRVTIAYFSGSLTHRGDFEEAADAVLWALETYAHVDFLTVGSLDLDARFERFATRIERVSWHPWQTLPELQARTDVSLAPLAPSSFSECKSCVKYLEASLVGVPTVASARSDFLRVIEDGRNGLLARGAPGWRHALRLLIEDAALRREIGERARADVLESHTTTSRLEQVEDLWHSLTSERTGLDAPLRVDWLLGSDPSDARLEHVVALARSLAERDHTLRLCTDQVAVADRLDALDTGSTKVLCGPWADLTPVDARIATDALTAYTLRYHESALFRFRLVVGPDEVGLELPIRHVCLGADVAERVSARSRRPAWAIEPGSDAVGELDRLLRQACFVRLSTDRTRARFGAGARVASFRRRS
jgi:glycosyltransferase involved in cell wall biosynthesis